MKHTSTTTLSTTPSIAEHKKVSKKLAKAIEDTTKSHWIDWLENTSAQDVYLVNKYVTNKPSDYSNAHCIPTFKISTDNSNALAMSNVDEVDVFSASFFPPPTSIARNFSRL